ncbi:MAG TPA: DJ-1/PfpI family protein [Bryobacteraceae bacterium]|nr:DJ-1/PfpI family protein [Bryobacteraceae bacterium]
MLRVVFVAVPPVQIIDLTSPFEVFARCGGYQVELVTTAPEGFVTSSSGLTICHASAYNDLRGPVDTLIVPGGDGAEELLCDAEFLAWLHKMSTQVRRIGSVCTGAFLLGAAGILKNRHAATHWRYCDRLERGNPDTRVERDPIFVKDGHVYTSAGVTAGIDLALALVEEDHGPRRALEIARDLVMFLRRPGGQAQFSSLLAAQASSRRPIEDLQAWVLGHLNEDLSVDVLASRCGMSPRQFARVFAAEKGVTPARFVEQTRVHAARVILEETTNGVKEVALQTGFGSADSMRRSFVRILGVSPGEYAERFRRLKEGRGQTTAPAPQTYRSTTASREPRRPRNRHSARGK